MNKDVIQTNPQQFQSTIFQSEKLSKDKNIEESSCSEITTHDNFLDTNFTQEQILDNFDFVLTKKTRQVNSNLNVMKTMDLHKKPYSTIISYKKGGGILKRKMKTADINMNKCD